MKNFAKRRLFYLTALLFLMISFTFCILLMIHIDKKENSSTYELKYVITSINYDTSEYYGKRIGGSDGIYFLDESIKEGDKIEIGDTITGVFYTMDDDIVKVYKSKK